VTYRVSTSRLADRQIEAALRWWRRNRRKAPYALADDIEEAKQLLSSQPLIGRPVRNTRRRNVRCFHLDRVSYNVYYQVIGREVHIVTLWHASRRPPRL
jgi:plasmid stabilization system protein ParE